MAGRKIATATLPIFGILPSGNWTGNLDDGERELLAASKLKPADPEIRGALELIAGARNQYSGSAARKAQ